MGIARRFRCGCDTSDPMRYSIIFPMHDCLAGNRHLMRMADPMGDSFLSPLLVAPERQMVSALAPVSQVAEYDNRRVRNWTCRVFHPGTGPNEDGFR